MSFLGVNVKQPPVGHHFGAADVEGLALYCVGFQAANQVGEDIANGDGLHGVVDPAGGEHYRQAVHQVAHDLKGGSPRTQDHGGPEESGGHGPGVQDAGHFKAGAQVLAEMGVVLAAQAT